MRVEAVSEANLQAETGGRITSVSVDVGDTVSAGKVLATIESSAQRAALVQAQGAYEAAVAAFLAGEVTYSEIAASIEYALAHAIAGEASSLDDLIAADAQARRDAVTYLQKRAA